MKIIKIYKNKWQQIPAGIRRMVIMGSLILIAWKALYTFWLEPKRILDQPLTLLVAKQTAELLQSIWPEGKYQIVTKQEYFGHTVTGSIEHLFILKDGKTTIAIADYCNGLELMILYGAFIVCLPGKAGRKWAFILIGIPLLHIANLVRCMGLVGMQLQWPGMFDFAHHYLFKIMVYGITFGLWVLYLKPVTKNYGKN